MKAIVTTYYTDPSHGWLKVPKHVLRKLGIEDKITSYSYMKGEYAYLEEDQDLGTFSKAVPNWEEWRQKAKHSYSDKRSRIRNYSNYEVIDESIAQKIRNQMYQMYSSSKAHRQIKNATIDTLRFWNDKFQLNYIL